jgi:hypothetical protein
MTPAILGEIQPEHLWLSNWDLFKAKLEFNFGPFNKHSPSRDRARKNHHEGASQSSEVFH